tara:strand:- start:761 stop:1633 length:873 start_codon:yes stop_codon:yes gene_type:complete
MILSMTGYGKSVEKNKHFTVCVDVKSINSRFIEISTKIPNVLRKYDNEIISLLKKECVRGKIAININFTNNNSNMFVLNDGKLNSLISLTNKIKKTIKSNENLLLSDVLNISEIYDEINLLDNVSNKRLIFKAIKLAIKDLKKFRIKEGNNLLKDLLKKIKKVKSNLDKIKKISTNNVNNEYKKLIKKIKSITKKVNNLDNERFYQESALLIEKKDINEEIVRMHSHIKLFNQYTLNRENSGKKMNFLLQEMLRETNTIGAKSTNVKVSHLVVDLKNNLEQLKEQVQNIL